MNFKAFARELLPHAAWRVLEWTVEKLAAAGVIAAVFTAFLWLKSHIDIASIVIVFAASLAVLLLTGRGRRIKEPGRSHSQVSVYENWLSNDVKTVLLSARHSLVIVDTWFADAPQLDGVIHEIRGSLPSPLRVEVYMLDPTRPFGGQRVAEFNGSPGGADSEWRREYTERFKVSANLLRTHMSRFPNVDLAIYTYTTMPSIRMFVADETHFVFSWFPSDGPSAQNVCFHATCHLDSAERTGVGARLKKQLEAVRKTSKPLVAPFDAGKSDAARKGAK